MFDYKMAERIAREIRVARFDNGPSSLRAAIAILREVYKTLPADQTPADWGFKFNDMLSDIDAIDYKD